MTITVCGKGPSLVIFHVHLATLSRFTTTLIDEDNFYSSNSNLKLNFFNSYFKLIFRFQSIFSIILKTKKMNFLSWKINLKFSHYDHFPINTKNNPKLQIFFGIGNERSELKFWQFKNSSFKNFFDILRWKCFWWNFFFLIFTLKYFCFNPSKKPE